MFLRVSCYLRRVFGIQVPFTADVDCDSLRERFHVQSNGVFHTEYDKTADILLAWFDEPRPATNIEVERDLFVRLDQQTGDVIGIEVIDCAARFNKAPSAITAVFARDLLERYGSRAQQMRENEQPTETDLPLFAAQR